MTAHVALLRGWLREKHGFDGVVVSDYDAIRELMNHGVAANLVEAATLALKAGVDIDMMSDAYRHGLPTALERGMVTMEEIDTAVRRVLTLKERLGLFEKPYGRGAKPEAPAAIARRRRLARDVGARSIVMLTNERNTLPLGSVRKLALIGPLADAGPQMGGPWGAAQEPEKHVSVLEGLRNALGNTVEILHSEGVSISGDDTSGVTAAVSLCDDADAVVLCVGEGANMSGEAASRAYLDLPGQQRAFAESTLERARHCGKPVIVVLFSGRPLAVPWLVEQADAVLAAWFLGSEAGNAISDVLLGSVSPTGRTPMSWPRAVGQIPIFFGERPSGRPANKNDHYTTGYMDVPNEPLFPFGHGLTYGRFVYSNLRVTPARVRETDTVEVRVNVTNEGTRAAQETVFLFMHDKVASVTRPLLELKGFGKIALKPGASGEVTLQVAAAELKFPGLDLTPVFEAGEVEVLVGPCADRKQLLQQSVQLL